jgi:hypothetical protein
VKSVRSWYDWIGLLAAGLSLYNFSVHVWHLRVSEMFGEILRYYRSLFHPIASFFGDHIHRWASEWLGWNISIPNDVLILYVLGAGCMWRTMERAWIRSIETFGSVEQDGDLSSKGLRFFVSLLWPLFIVTIGVYHIPGVGKKVFADELRDGDELFPFMMSWGAIFLKEALIVVAFMFVFVGISASGLSLF